MHIRQALQQGRVHDAENRRVRANPERKCEHERHREPRILPKHPKTELNILQHCLAEVGASNLTTLLANFLVVAKSASRRASGLFRRNAVSDILRRPLLDMKPQLLINLLLLRPICPKRAESPPKKLDWIHDWAPVRLSATPW